ncbi:MAG: amidohydrolase family protein [Gammaproteobacteria bacterium]|nr:amidohydrolase family protein [Gammaproteobacteria bacterium]
MRIFNTATITVCFVFSCLCVSAGELLIENAKIYTASEQGTIENGYILIQDNKIAKVGERRDFDFTGQTIDAEGRSITPGLVNSYTQLGLVEINAVSHSVDFVTEDKLFGPSFKISSAINPASTAIPHNRINGLTHAIVVPEPGHLLFAGYGAAIRLAHAENMILDDSLALFINFAAQGSKLSGGSRASAYSKLRQSLLDAQDYMSNRKESRRGQWRDYFLPLHDLEALLPILKGDKQVVITVHRASDIRLVLSLQKEFKLKVILAGASEAWLVADQISAAGVPVIIDPMANLLGDFDQLAARLDSASRLQSAGVTLLFTGVAWRNTHSAYTVRQAAGNAVAYGLTVEDAIKAMSSNPARVFGYADRFGSIESGKIADLVIWDGHPLEILTRADSVIMNGKPVAMVSRSTRLRDRYRELNTLYPPAYQK